MSANNYSGVVADVKKNDAGYFSLKMTDGEWFGCGKVKPPVSTGDEVSFDYSKNGKYNNADVDTIEVISEGNNVPAPKAKWSGKKSGGDADKSAYWDAKEARDITVQKEIRYQASRNSALTALDIAIKHNLVTIPDAKKGTSQMEVFLTYVNKLTNKFMAETEALHTPPEAPKPVAKPVKATKAVVKEPEDDEDEEDVVEFLSKHVDDEGEAF